jgi:hypothetical protein
LLLLAHGVSLDASVRAGLIRIKMPRTAKSPGRRLRDIDRRVVISQCSILSAAGSGSMLAAR